MCTEPRTHCTTAMIEVFHGIRARNLLAAREWASYRQIDPSLKPWGPYESIASVNPQVLKNDHSMQTHCFNNFWTRDYATKETPTAPSDTWMVYCREHECYEYPDFKNVHLLSQLGSGLFQRYRDWGYVVVVRGYREKGQPEEPDRLELSHGCGNGFGPGNVKCVNIMCSVREIHTVNIQRNTCHRAWELDPNGDTAECICPGGLTRECVLGRTHPNFKDIKD
jgi:hypothetical protein